MTFFDGITQAKYRLSRWNHVPLLPFQINSEHRHRIEYCVEKSVANVEVLFVPFEE
jgi:hypothetical protein